MSEPNKGMSCGLGCWALAAGVGLLTIVLLLVLGSFGWIAAIFLGGVVFLLIGVLTSWIFCRDLPGPVVGPNAEGPTHLSGAPDKTEKPAAAAPASKASDAKPAVATASATADAEAGAAVKPSKPLAGQEELASRKGTWKYGADDAPATPAAAAAAASGGDAGPGSKPVTYDAPPEGGADDLKKIKGIGPKLEQLCNSMGFYTFAQVAAWTPQEVAWVDDNLEGFKGRVSRDAWVDQAKLLASGEETEFSKKVDKGDVYD
ncbi:endonuclease [Thalassococcus sp. BH17M4-6]|uniref:endonuclease n=1 Tax=Thalassococcus sp. BH17M4-6 TaxID=3413148 RepID=UPI003BD1334C